MSKIFIFLAVILIAATCLAPTGAFADPGNFSKAPLHLQKQPEVLPSTMKPPPKVSPRLLAEMKRLQKEYSQKNSDQFGEEQIENAKELDIYKEYEDILKQTDEELLMSLPPDGEPRP